MFAALPVEPNPDSVEIMRHIDRLNPRMRALVHEFGYVIVRDMLADADSGYDPDELRSILETWRDRRQAQWLATDYVTKKTAASIVNAAIFAAATRQAA